MYIAKREGLPIGTPLEYDHFQYLHQVPGGMISNLRHQLGLIGMEDKLEETLEEAVQVRADFGYPIMVTPLSQFVGSQAAINVLLGERYKEVTDQVIQYALGIWGKEAVDVMDPNVKEKILNRSRAKEFTNRETPEPSIQEIRQKFGGPGISDEELLLRFFAGPEAVEEMRSSGPRREYMSYRTPLVTLIHELTKRKDCNRIYIRKGDLTLTLGRNETSAIHSESGT
jgi:oxaloacetate decarboxylase alpha subunit